MPGPVPKNINSFSGGALNVARAETKLMAQVAAVAVAWTEVERLLVQLVDGALGSAHIQDGGAVGMSGNWVAKVAMEQAETIRTRIKLVDATVQPMLEGSELESRWQDLKQELRKRSRERNEVVHAAWHYTHELPGELVRLHEGGWERWTLQDFQGVQTRLHRLTSKLMSLTYDIGKSKAVKLLDDLPIGGNTATAHIKADI